MDSTHAHPQPGREPLHEWRCPNCRHVTRARMADHGDPAAKLAAIRELHRPSGPDEYCHEDGCSWPCPTVRAIGEGAGDAG